MDKRPAILDLSLTKLSPEDRDAYAAIIDEILAEYDEEVISSDDVLEMLRERTRLALTRQRHHIKLLIIERLRMQPTPRTVAFSHTEGVSRTNSTVAAVFNIPELLDTILSYVPMVDLIRSRHVNKAVHRHIETSPALQRKLFLLPSSDPPRYYGWDCNSETEEMITWLDGPPPSSNISTTSPDNTFATLNPLSPAVYRDFDMSPDGTQMLALVHSTRIDKRILESKTWPEMYLTSPPCTSVDISFDYFAESDAQRQPRLTVRRRVRDPAGVTFATVWKVLHEEGHVVVIGNCELKPRDRWHTQRIDDTTLREQIHHHRRRGVRLVIDAEESVIMSYSVTIRTSGDGLSFI